MGSREVYGCRYPYPREGTITQDGNRLFVFPHGKRIPRVCFYNL